VIIGIVVLELIACVCITILIGLGNRYGAVVLAPLQAWLACAILQLAIHYWPRGRYARYSLLASVMLLLLASATLEGVLVIPYLHQALFIAGVASLPQLWWEWSSKATKGRVLGLGLIGLVSLPLGCAIWGLANIWIVKAKAWSAAQGETHCILVSHGGGYFSRGDYDTVSNDWELTGWRMFRVRGAGGSGNCCQHDFHALLLTRSNRLFNWSYQSQRFEPLSERSRDALGLRDLTCGGVR